MAAAVAGGSPSGRAAVKRPPPKLERPALGSQRRPSDGEGSLFRAAPRLSLPGRTNSGNAAMPVDGGGSSSSSAAGVQLKASEHESGALAAGALPAEGQAPGSEERPASDMESTPSQTALSVSDVTPGNVLGSWNFLQSTRLTSASVSRSSASGPMNAAAGEIEQSYFLLIGRLTSYARRGYRCVGVKRCQNRLSTVDPFYLHGYVVLQLIKEPDHHVIYLRIDWTDRGWEMQQEDNELNFVHYLDQDRHIGTRMDSTGAAAVSTGSAVAIGTVIGAAGACLVGGFVAGPAGVAAAPIIADVGFGVFAGGSALAIASTVGVALEDYVETRGDDEPEGSAMQHLANRLADLHDERPRYDLGSWNCNHAANFIRDALIPGEAWRRYFANGVQVPDVVHQ
eukprot:TRINITY_DN93972_c0_g1_i1.p1 TRINITY_DN93972_c0_g1~~TRINITY_DN93972_c0_g1_i1.p1  ORF type:complete len:413 (+),score=62.18 TRINITY_DN93972_c0_g1_i1:50-1240(+)